MLFGELAAASRRVAETSGRLEKIAILAAVLRDLPADEIEIGLGFLSGWPRQGRLGLGWAAVAGTRAEPAAETAPPLSLTDVDRAFAEITAARGKGAAQRRQETLRSLTARATPTERDFLAALIRGEVRQGALEGILLEAVAKAAAVDPRALRRAVMLAGDLGLVAAGVLTGGEAALARHVLEVFQPIQPMLADSAADLADAMKRLGRAALEYKLDGARIQVHKSGPEVRVYTRSLNEVTGSVPEVVELVESLPADRLVLDGEVIALDRSGRPEPFQVTMRRFGRRLDVIRAREEIPLAPFFFDLMLADGDELLTRPQSERFARLVATVPASAVVPSILTEDPAAADRFLAEALARGHEGVMAKAPGAPYDAGRRGGAWLKVKTARTLDLVVLAAEWGSGRRKGWLSNIHLGARDPAGGFVMLGKTFKGMTDEMLAWQTAEFLAREVSREGHIVWLRPELVVEVEFNDVQRSPQYPGGVALRFARVKRYRPDKTAAEADTIETVLGIA